MASNFEKDPENSYVPLGMLLNAWVDAIHKSAQ
jgi:hypothetical protein